MQGAVSVAAADVDGDGHVDVLGACLVCVTSSEPSLVWLENDGGTADPLFTSHPYGNFYDGIDVTSGDVDGDGDEDLVSMMFVLLSGGLVVLSENDGGSPPTFQARFIRLNRDGGAGEIRTADIDGDGDLDILFAGAADDKIAWLENDGARPPAAIERVVTVDPDGLRGPLNGPADGVRSVRASDVDGDGDLDIVSASSRDDRVIWWESDGASLPAFSPHVITSTADGANGVAAVDLDGDGDVDVVSASFDDDKIAWYENLGPTPGTLELRLEPDLLWPPDLRLVEVTATVTTGEGCPVGNVVLDSITVEETSARENGTGSAAVSTAKQALKLFGDDIQEADLGTADSSFLLRAWRSASSTGRTYRVTYRGEDCAGRVIEATAIVTVPHDQGSGAAPR